MRNTIAIALVTAVVGSMGCSFAKRGPDKYRDDTRALLETKSGEVKGCYDAIVKNDQKAVGNVTIWFKVAKETGQIMDAKVENASAPQAVQDCVLNSLSGLALKPPDADDGHATFTYEFEVAAAKAPAKQSGFEAK